MSDTTIPNPSEDSTVLDRKGRHHPFLMVPKECIVFRFGETYEMLLERARSGNPFEIEADISPETFERFLSRNYLNRNPYPRNINYWAEDIEDGRWVLVGDVATFNIDGDYQDGQNRGLAGIKAGKPIRILVGFNYSVEAKSKTNIGKARTSGDILKTKNFKSEESLTRIGAIARAMLCSYRAETHQKQEDIEAHLTIHLDIIQKIYRACRGVSSKKIVPYKVNWVAAFANAAIAYTYKGLPDAEARIIKLAQRFVNQEWSDKGDYDPLKVLQYHLITRKGERPWDTYRAAARAVQIAFKARRNPRKQYLDPMTEGF